MTGDTDLIQQAALGSTAAQLGLVDNAIAAGASGAVRQIEALASAETCARLAAAGGGIAENRALVGVMLSRATFELERCAVQNSQWYENEARRVLGLLLTLDPGDEDTKTALAELGDAAADHHGPGLECQAALCAAGRGSLAALSSLYDEAVRLLAQGGTDPLDVLVPAELYARLGSASGDADQLRRLAGILLKRAEYEYRDGWDALGHNAVAEAAVLLSILVDTGEHSMVTWLSLLVTESHPLAVASAAQSRPTILAYMAPEGSC